MKTTATLIKESIDGSESSQRELYLMYRVKWYMLSKRYAKNATQADDIFQEGLIQIYKDLHQFDSSKSSFDTWSYRVMTHSALRFLKKNSWNQAFEDLEKIADFTIEEESIFEQFSSKELTKLIQELPTGYRLVFNMYVLEGYSHKEIAKKLDINDGTSRSQLAKAKRMLRKKLEHQLSEFS